MFNNAVNISGSNPTFNQADVQVKVYQSSRSKGFKSLTKHVATGALHNSGEVPDAPKCHPGTRVAILGSVVQWAMASVYLFCIQWIYGPAGAGKSAILRTLAERLEKRGQLLASFFFFRTAAHRNNTDRFIPTIAYQIALSIPSTRRHIEQAIETDPLIFSQSLEAQAQALIILPITQAHKEGGIGQQYPRIMIVDGLDECRGEEKQRVLLRVLNNMLLKLPISFAILIASRPEPHIRHTFNTDLNKTSTRLELDNSYEPDKDIQKFYEDKFLEIRKHHPQRPSLPNPWPPHPVIMTLVDKASGQFIFPATVIKFVEPHRHHPSARLAMIMGSISPGKLRPFEALDNLYSTIFASIDSDDLKAALTVLGILLVPYDDTVVEDMHLLTFLTGYNQTEVKQWLFDLESLLQIKVEGHSTSIHIHHASLADFLFDQHRAGCFFVSPRMIYEQLARRCLDNLSSEGEDKKYEYLRLHKIPTNLPLPGPPECLDCHLHRAEYVDVIDVELGPFLSNAEPTEELIRTLKDCNAVRLSQKLEWERYLLSILRIFLSKVLPAISSSDLPDFIHAHLLATLREVIASRVDYCFGANLRPLVMYLMDLLDPSNQVRALFSGSSIYGTCYNYIYPIEEGRCPIEITDQDQQNGFCLTLRPYCTDLFDLWEDPLMSPWVPVHSLLIDIIGNRAGDCYADFTIRTLNWISNRFRTVPDQGLPDDLQEVAAFFLPRLLRKSPPRLDVQQALGDNPLHSIMLEKIPKYAAAIWKYFLRANSESGQDDTDSSEADADSSEADADADADSSRADTDSSQADSHSSDDGMV